MSTFDPQLLLPPTEDDDVRQQRRVWPSLAALSGALAAIALLLQLGGTSIQRAVPVAFDQPVAVVVALLPLGLWVFTDWLSERRHPQPRPRLAWVAALTALLANAVLLPFYRLLEPTLWLPHADGLTRFVGVLLTYALLPAVLQVVVVRATVWPQHYVQREDAIAYAVACAVGLSIILNLHYVLQDSPNLAAVGRQVFTSFALHVVIALVVGYGLAETGMTTSPVLLLPSSVVAASVIAAVMILAGERLAGAALRVGPALTQPLRGLLVYGVAVVAVSVSVQFLQRSADRAMREALPSDR